MLTFKLYADRVHNDRGCGNCGTTRRIFMQSLANHLTDFNATTLIKTVGSVRAARSIRVATYQRNLLGPQCAERSRLNPPLISDIH